MGLMGLSMVLTGAKELLAGFSQVEKRADGMLHERLRQIAEMIMEESEELVPVDTGYLKSTAFIEDNGQGFDFGYSASYAMSVHELPAFHAAPTQYKFLEIPARNHMDRMEKLLGGIDPLEGIDWPNEQ